MLLNLCLNGRDAMPEGGVLRVRAHLQQIDSPQGMGAEEAEPGPYVVVEVSDQGQGISPEHLDTIFEPFFTTKGPTQGTGLGLPSALGIVRSRGGFLQVSSEVGRGTTVAVFLPVAERPVSLRSPLTPPWEERLAGLDVLLVDDEEAVQRATARLLRRDGYAVRVASDGVEALLQLEDRLPDVVLTDVHMPRMDGVELVRAVQLRWPALPVVMMSGRFDDAALRDSDQLRVVRLEKPYGRRDLREAVSRALDSATTPQAR